MNIIITDDESLARQRLRKLLNELDHEVVAEASQGQQALQLCQQMQPDLILLDIRMPVMDGIETARHLMALENPPAVIFTTAFDEHALQAFETNAVDYLLKPIRKQKLQDSLQRAGKLNRLQLSRTATQTASRRSHIAARSHQGVKLVAVDDILFFMAEQKYVNVVSMDSEDLIEESLKSLEQEFGDRFVRIHRNALIAKNAISGLQKGADASHCLVVKNSDKILDVSRRHLPAVRKLIQEMGK